MKKIIVCLLSFVLLLSTAFGCVDTHEEVEKILHCNSYAMPYREIFKNEFLFKEENRINIAYPKEIYYPSDSDSERYFMDDTLPNYRVIFIKDQATADEAFVDQATADKHFLKIPTVDFEKEMIAVILFSVIGNYSISLRQFVIENNTLSIVIEKITHSGSSMPILEAIVVVFDITEITETNVRFIR